MDLGVAAGADLYEMKSDTGEWWFLPVQKALGKFGLYEPPETRRLGGQRDSVEKTDQDSVSWL